MKVLLDSCVWGGVQPVLENGGHEVQWVGQWPSDPGDEAILARAFREGRTLVTLDKDFGNLAIGQGLPHGGIVRLVNLRAQQQAGACLRIFESHAAELASGALITATAERLRIRLPHP